MMLGKILVLFARRKF